METPSPLEISDLRLRLRALHGTSEESLTILNEIATLGHNAAPLVPDLITAMQHVYFPPMQLVPIICKLKNADLLKAALGRDQCGLLSFDKCKLLKAGFLQFQASLIDELFRDFENYGNPCTHEIVDALAEAGTSAALETLRVIEYRTSSRIPELNAELNREDVGKQAATQLMRGEFLPERVEFLQKVRHAIQRIGERPDPLPVPDEHELCTESPSVLLDTQGLLAQREHERLEFKAALRWDCSKGMVEEKLERHVLKTIAGFANGKGGTLLIGIDADRKVVGLQNDYASLKGDSDLFERHLRQSLQTQVGKAVTVLKVRISFHEISGKEVCRVDVDASSEPLFFKAGNIEEFFVRSGNATIRMEGEQLVKYIRERFVK
jgi:hypothetical protein